MPTEHANNLTEAEAERLAILAEECAEVIQQVCKIQRHGFNNDWLKQRLMPSNRDRLEEEVGHLKNAINVMLEAGDMSYSCIGAALEAKQGTIAPYLHHQGGD